jgi:hypothetical protein
MDVILYKKKMEMGSDNDGAPRYMDVFTFSLPQFKVHDRKVGSVTFAEKEELPPLHLPYMIWRSAEQGRVRFRWARRHRGKPEMRISLSNHGAENDIRSAVSACLENHCIRERVKDDE